jgi:imidazolonepropionase-like amidohydrolase
MVEYGMETLQVLRAATSVNAKAFHLEDKLGFIKPGHLADLVFVSGDPSKNISDLRKVTFVMKEGKVVRDDK